MCLVASAIGLAGCLVTSSSDFPEPVQTRPYLRAATSSPRLDQLIVVRRSTGKVTFSVELQSEDNGQPVLARLVAGWPDTKGTLVKTVEVPPGTFTDVRLVSLEWSPSSPVLTTGEVLPVGCYPVTLIVTHQFNELTNQPARSEDADFLVWWLLMGDVKATDDAALGAVRAIDCPSAIKLPAGQPGAGGG